MYHNTDKYITPYGIKCQVFKIAHDFFKHFMNVVNNKLYNYVNIFNRTITNQIIN